MLQKTQQQRDTVCQMHFLPLLSEWCIGGDMVIDGQRSRSVMHIGEQGQKGAWQASPCWWCSLNVSPLHKVWFWIVVCSCLLDLASFCDSSQIHYWSHPFLSLEADCQRFRKWSSTHSCLLSTLVFWYISVIVSHYGSLSCYPFLSIPSGNSKCRVNQA